MQWTLTRNRRNSARSRGHQTTRASPQPDCVGDTCHESSREGRGCGARPQWAWGHRGHLVSEGRCVLRRAGGAQVVGWEEGTGWTHRAATGASQGSRGGTQSCGGASGSRGPGGAEQKSGSPGGRCDAHRTATLAGACVPGSRCRREPAGKLQAVPGRGDLQGPWLCLASG